MTLIKFNNKPKSLFAPFDKNFDDMVNEFFGYTPTLYRTKSDFGATNVKETDESYNLEVLLPGFSKDETNVEIEDGMITISAKVEDTNSEETKDYNRQEFVKKSFVRAFNLPDDVDEDRISADMKDGVLFVSLNKKEEVVSKPKKIKIL